MTQEAGGELPAALAPLSWLVGSWRCERARVSFPTMSDVYYDDNMQFLYAGQPMFTYQSTSCNSDTSKPMHRESGFLRVFPDGDSPAVSLLIAQNIGLTEILEGRVEAETMTLDTIELSRMTASKAPAAIKSRRVYKRDPTSGHIIYKMFLASESTRQLTLHLEADYSRFSG